MKTSKNKNKKAVRHQGISGSGSPCRMARAVRVDSRIYSKESLSLASRIFSGRLAVVLRPAGGPPSRNIGKRQSLPNGEGGSIDVTLQTLEAGQNLEFLAGEFFNEALNQECRLILSRENANIQKMLITKAFFSARAGSQNSQRKQLSAAKKKVFERETKKLLMQAKKEMADHSRTARHS